MDDFETLDLHVSNPRETVGVNSLQDKGRCARAVTEIQPDTHLNLSFLKQQITEVAADVIVSSFGRNEDMLTGQLSRCIYLEGLQVGDILWAPSGRLKCKEICHCCLPHWNRKVYRPDEMLRQVVLECIVNASSKGYKSIAFPALGTGNLGYPKSVTAAAIIDTVRAFHNVPLFLADVYVVGLPEDVDFEVVERRGGRPFRVPVSVDMDETLGRTVRYSFGEDCTREVVDKRIQKLKFSQIADLEAFAKKESVDISTSQFSGQVRLKGPHQGLNKVCHHLDEILQTVADFGFVAYPICWERVESDQRVFNVDKGSTEYISVRNSFMAALCDKAKHVIISKIERIQIPDLYKQYQIAMQTVQKEHPSRDNERIMWHGTDVEAVHNINKYGFNRSYSGKNATLYGQGAYFAVNADTPSSTTYSPPDKQGIKYVYRARVLTGTYTKGDAAMRDPPRVDPARSVRFTSTTNNPSRPSLFCIYRDTHSYPEYLISFLMLLP